MCSRRRQAVIQWRHKSNEFELMQEEKAGYQCRFKDVNCILANICEFVTFGIFAYIENKYFQR